MTTCILKNIHQLHGCTSLALRVNCSRGGPKCLHPFLLISPTFWSSLLLLSQLLSSRVLFLTPSLGLFLHILEKRLCYSLPGLQWNFPEPAFRRPLGMKNATTNAERKSALGAESCPPIVLYMVAVVFVTL